MMPYMNALPPTVLERPALPPNSLFYVVGFSLKALKGKMYTDTRKHRYRTHATTPPSKPDKAGFVCVVLLVYLFLHITVNPDEKCLRCVCGHDKI